MKNKCYFLLLAVSLICCFPSIVHGADVDDIIIDTIKPSRLNLKGKVKLFKEFIYYAIDNNGILQSGEMAKDSDFVIKADYKTNQCYIFNISGYNIQTNEYWSPTEVFTIQKNTFQGKRLIRSNTEYRFSDGVHNSKCVYSYNDKGLITSYNLYSMYGVLAAKYLYKYDSHNNIIWQRGVDGDGEIEYTETADYQYEGDKLVYSKKVSNRYSDVVVEKKYEYNDKGLITKRSTKYNTSSWHVLYEYDENGRLIMETEKEETGDIISVNHYKYDQQGNLIEKESIRLSGAKYTDTYDIEGKTHIFTRFSKEGILEGKQVYVDNNLMEYYDGKNTYEYKYTFDSKGNWIKAIEEKNSIPTYIKVRTIQYFQ